MQRNAGYYRTLKQENPPPIEGGTSRQEKLNLKETNRTYLIERRTADTGVSLAPLTAEVTSLRQTI